MEVRECWVENHIGMVPLSNGQVAMVDEDRLSEVSNFNWCAAIGYAKSGGVFMHRFLYPELKEIDHANMNRLDNRSCNLREATRSQNQSNRGKQRNNKSGFKGVIWCKHRNRWRVNIRLNGKSIHIGYFTCLIKAAKAYDLKAQELFGQFYKEEL